MPSQRFLSLITVNTSLSAEDWRKLDAAIAAWARKTTDATTRRHDDLIRDKQVLGAFEVDAPVAELFR